MHHDTETAAAAAGSHPLILYIPGLMPKPPAGLHRDALKRCLLASVMRVDPEAGDAIRSLEDSFDVVAWNYDFYGSHRDITVDTAAIDAVIERAAASLAEMREASSWRRRLALSIYRTGDRLPFLIPHLASEQVELHLRDLHRYVGDEDGAAERARGQVKMRLRAAHEARRPLLLLAHSMGSVIAYESLWQLSHGDAAESLPLDTFITLGSPLGQRYLQRRLLGHDAEGAGRYPGNIRRWINITAVGDMTALDPTLADDYGEMCRLGLLESIRDLSLYSHYRQDGKLNVHAEYGYLASAVTGKVVANWWRECASGNGQRERKPAG